MNKNQNPKIGLIALASDYMIEKDFINVIKDKKIDFFVNRIQCFNPLTKESTLSTSISNWVLTPPLIVYFFAVANL